MGRPAASATILFGATPGRPHRRQGTARRPPTPPGRTVVRRLATPETASAAGRPNRWPGTPRSEVDGRPFRERGNRPDTTPSRRRAVASPNRDPTGVGRDMRAAIVLGALPTSPWPSDSAGRLGRPGAIRARATRRHRIERRPMHPAVPESTINSASTSVAGVELELLPRVLTSGDADHERRGRQTHSVRAGTHQCPPAVSTRMDRPRTASRSTRLPKHHRPHGAASGYTPPGADGSVHRQPGPVRRFQAMRVVTVSSKRLIRSTCLTAHDDTRSEALEGESWTPIGSSQKRSGYPRYDKPR
jgi:hypothetical protein